MNYLWHILVLINIYAILAASLDLVVGYTGLLSLCHASFYGIGAYACTLAMMRLGWGFLPAMLFAIPIASAASYVIGLPSLRLRGDYFVLATLGFQMIVFALLYNWIGLTNGPYGIPGIPVPRVFGIQVNSVFGFFVLSGCIALICLVLLWKLTHSPFGLVLKAVRDDEIAAAALGKNVPRVKMLAFAISGGLAAIPGALFAGYMRYIDPTSFTLMESIFILSIVVIGGAGRFWGAILGAAFLVLLPEALRFLQVPAAIAPNLRQIIYGVVIVLLMRFRPQGFIGEYKFN